MTEVTWAYYLYSNSPAVIRKLWKVVCLSLQADGKDFWGYRNLAGDTAVKPALSGNLKGKCENKQVHQPVFECVTRLLENEEQ